MGEDEGSGSSRACVTCSSLGEPDSSGMILDCLSVFQDTKTKGFCWRENGSLEGGIERLWPYGQPVHCPGAQSVLEGAMPVLTGQRLAFK
jgi:hypothetical protein